MKDPMTDLTLVIANKNTSSWSLRSWLLLKHFDIPFEEQLVRFQQPDTREQLQKHSPSGLVPALKAPAGEMIWDSLAIAETMAEWYPEKAMWPEDLAARAHARCLSAEMHSGFSNLRTVWPMDVRKEHVELSVPAVVKKALTRICELWTEARNRFGADGPFLYGSFTIADAMYAPVVSRIRTYGPVSLFDPLADYMEAIWTLPAMQEWRAAALEEEKQGWYD